MQPPFRHTPCLTAALILTGCDGPQSALAPASGSAGEVVDLFWLMLTGAALLWLLAMALMLYAGRRRRRRYGRWTARVLIIGCGAVLPAVVLAGLLVYGLSLLPATQAPADEGLRITVVGERWWWRVRYQVPGRPDVVSANEIRLPVGKRVELRLETADVIHSFWVPPLGGKLDMIPGRTNRLVLAPTQAGVFRGACAEFCGASHALMAFMVVTLPPAEFDAWLAREAAPAAAPAGPEAERGRQAFLANGCGACHAIRGTPADGVVGPDLTHLGGRLSLAAGILPMDTEAIARWLARTDTIKPEALMPAFHMLPADERQAIAVYLRGLE